MKTEEARRPVRRQLSRQDESALNQQDGSGDKEEWTQTTGVLETK